MEFDFEALAGIEDTSSLETQLNNNNEFISPREREIQAQNQSQANEVLDELESDTESESDYMDAVEERLGVAAFYQALLKNPLFNQKDNKRANIVEKEVRDFCRHRLEVLVGIKPNTVTMAKVELPFSKEQIDALVQIANMLLNKSKAPVNPVVTPVKVSEPIVNPVKISPATSTVSTTKQVPKKPGPKPKVNINANKPLFEEKVVGVSETGREIKIKNQRVQKPTGMKPFPANLEQVQMQVAANQVAQVEKSVGAGQSLFNKIITHHTGGGNTGE